MTPIKHDPARRIRRVQRWLEECGQMIPGAEWIYPNCVDERHDKCNALFAREIAWLCDYASTQDARRNGLRDALAQQYGDGLEVERAVLDEVKAWASEEINELRSKLDTSEAARKSAEFYLSIETPKADRCRAELLDAKRTIAEQKARLDKWESAAAALGNGEHNVEAILDLYMDRDLENKTRIEELESSVTGLREGLEDMESMRRIQTIDDMRSEIAFYLSRDNDR